jgi:hypothetical protein
MDKNRVGIKEVTSMSIDNLETGEELLRINNIKESQKPTPQIPDKSLKIEDLIKLRMCASGLDVILYVDEENYEKIQNHQK